LAAEVGGKSRLLSRENIEQRKKRGEKIEIEKKRVAPWEAGQFPLSKGERKDGFFRGFQSWGPRIDRKGNKGERIVLN